MALIHSTTVRNGANGDEVMSHTIKCLTPTELEAVVKSVGMFEPGKHDPLDILTSLETCVNVYRLTAFADKLLEAFKTYSGSPDIVTGCWQCWKFDLINESYPLTRSTIEMLVTHL